jgi:hypothetical protein
MCFCAKYEALGKICALHNKHSPSCISRGKPASRSTSLSMLRVAECSGAAGSTKQLGVDGLMGPWAFHVVDLI